MSLEYIFPDHTKRNRHIAIVVECVAAAVALALGFWAFWQYRIPSEVPKSVQTQVQDPLADKKEALQREIVNVTFTDDVILEKKASIQSKVRVTNLSPDEIRERQAVIEGI